MRWASVKGIEKVEYVVVVGEFMDAGDGIDEDGKVGIQAVLRKLRVG